MCNQTFWSCILIESLHWLGANHKVHSGFKTFLSSHFLPGVANISKHGHTSVSGLKIANCVNRKWDKFFCQIITLKNSVQSIIPVIFVFFQLDKMVGGLGGGAKGKRSYPPGGPLMRPSSVGDFNEVIFET